MPSKSKEILLVTRPISPPWDEASKNFAYFIAKNISSMGINIMTKGILPELPSHIKQHPIYTSSEIADFNLEQKLRSLYFQIKSRGKFDIIHYFFTPTKLNSFLIKNFLTSKKTKIIQTVATLREDLWSNEDLRKLLFGNLIITYSDYAKNRLEKLGFENAIRIYPGIDIDKYSPTPKNPATLSQLGIKKSDFVITYPGEYVRLGATDEIVESLPEIFKKVPSAKFVFANRIKNEADAHKKKAIERILREKNILDRVVILNETFSDMPKLYNVSDIVVFPVRDMKGKFDVPLAVIEAMACEKPVIISNLPMLAEFAKEDNSVPMETGNFNQFIHKIHELHENPEKRTLIGKAARKYALENFDIKRVASFYEDIYKKI